MNKKNIFLIGMPGVGKSYWAEQIAAHYNRQFIDLDDIIEVKTSKSIGRFFDEFGEDEFRKLEKETLLQIIQVFPFNSIIACGGGTPCYYDNLAKMKMNGMVIYIQASIRYLIQNLEIETSSRPLLTQNNWQEELSKLYLERKDFYTQANHILMAQSLSIKDFDTVLHPHN